VPERTVKRSASARKASATREGDELNARGEQKRSIITRTAILNVALLEFAEHGFFGTSTRSIGKRAGIHNTLLTYHFRNKDSLWRATAKHFFEEIRSQLESHPPHGGDKNPIDRIRWEFHSFFNFITQYPEFHQFMMHESLQGGDRLAWLLDTFHRPILDRVIPEIEAAQASGDLPAGPPTLIFYFLIGVTTALSASRAEMSFHSGTPPDASDKAQEYWDVIEKIIFVPFSETKPD